MLLAGDLIAIDQFVLDAGDAFSLEGLSGSEDVFTVGAEAHGYLCCERETADEGGQDGHEAKMSEHARSQ
jgi:hypothetical protein